MAFPKCFINDDDSDGDGDLVVLDITRKTDEIRVLGAQI